MQLSALLFFLLHRHASLIQQPDPDSIRFANMGSQNGRRPGEGTRTRTTGSPQHVFKSAPTSQRALHFHPTASPSAADVVSQPLSTSDPAYHAMTETPKPGLTLRPLMVAILSGHSYSGYHTPQACFKRASSSPHSRPRTWLITSNPTTYDLRSSVHFCNQRTHWSLLSSLLGGLPSPVILVK